MKKSIIIFLCFVTYIFFGILDVNASISWTVSSGISNCTTGVPSSNTNSVSTSGTRACTTTYNYLPNNASYNVVVNKSGITSCGTGLRVLTQNVTQITCLSWDNTNPTVSANNSSNTVWRNSDISITLSTDDTGKNGTPTSTWFQARYSWSNDLDATCTSGGTLFSNGNTITNSTEGTRTLYLCARDAAGNVGTWSGIYMLDKTNPTVLDLPDNFPSVNPSNNSNLLATITQTFTITPSNNGGSPIVQIQGFFEDSSNCSNGFHARIDSNSSSITTISATHNIEEVKPTCDFNAGGYREYSFKITYIRDEAGNILGTLNAVSSNAGIKTYNYKVFANTLNITKTLTEQVTSTHNNVADGVTKNITIRLIDIHGNPIIPATFIGRTIDFNFNVNNNLYLNQSNNSGGSAVFMSIPSDSSSFQNDRISTGTVLNVSFDSQSVSNINNGDYVFGYRVLAPTNHIIAGNDYTINSITFDVNRTTSIIGGDNPSNESIAGTNLQFAFKPIYEASFAGDIVTDGFVEGTVQTGSIVIYQNGGVNPTVDGLYFLQTGSGSSYFSGTGKINTNPELSILKTNIGTNFISAFNISTNYIFRTLFTIGGTGYLNYIKDVQLKGYIRYNLNGNIVTYLAGTLNETNNQSFETLKIYGITNINKSKQKDLTADQDKKDVKNLAGQITKSTLRADIVKNALTTIKFVTPNNGTSQITNLSGSGWLSSGNGGKKLGNIIYFGNLAGANVEINDTTGNLEGKKTIIVKGGNLYIKSNIINNSSNDILGIIVIPDELNRGGKVYIDTNVQEVDAVIFAYKSIMSYNEIYDNGDTDSIKSHEVDGNIDNSVMQNQLYIFGTVFSENTIGGSRKVPVLCPFWTKSEGINCNDSVVAQKYDLNYLRAGYNNKYKASYANYPIIIKYNSTLQSSPPPLFGK
ncbi:MAG: hypothetical protein Q8K30_02580 [Candidatus Gracilibacteria bacterium]|nr:hypothetical protein [Candidatus Gracilibacteria bacterium]